MVMQWAKIGGKMEYIDLPLKEKKVKGKKEEKIPEPSENPEGKLPVVQESLTEISLTSDEEVSDGER